MLENPLGSGVIGVFLTLFIGLLLFGAGILKPAIRTAKTCFSLAAIVLFGWSSWIILILPIQVSFIIRCIIIFIIFVIVGIGWNRLLKWVDRSRETDKLIEKEQIVEPAPLFLHAEMVSGIYPPGTKLGGIIWTPDLRNLRITIQNPTKYDYQDLDVTVHLRFPSILIRQIGQISDLPGVSFIYMGPEVTQTLRTKDTDIVIPQRVYGNNYRLRCDKLYHNKSIVIAIAVAYKDILNKGKISKVLIKGQYSAQSQIRNFDEIVKVTNISLN